ncbi:MAG: protein-export chaperone SecB [Alphaproteobacteria bacterium]|nr:protein-export chaperone SecB [Alphaproteobacteria bacterium]
MNTNADASNPEAPQPPPVVINGQYIKDFSFEAPHAPGIFAEIKSPPEVLINIDVKADRIQDNVFESTLLFHIEGQVGEKKAFIVELTYCGVVAVHVPNEHLQPVLLIEVPRLLFPFARAIISDVTRDSGFPPLMIAPVDFVSLYRQRMEELAASAKPEQMN